MSKLFEALQRLGHDSSDVYTDFAAEARGVLQPVPPARDEVPQAGPPRRVQRSEVAPELRKVPVEDAYIDSAIRIVFHSDPRSAGADRFRLLRMRLRQLREMRELKTILVTSPLPRDGKSTVLLNLATALAEGGKRNVLVVEADLHRPSLCVRLGLPLQAGLTECIEDSLAPFSALRYVRPLDWYLLAAGQPRGNSTELLQSQTLPKIIHTLSPHFDWVLCDAPPVIPITDAVALRQHTNATLMVIRAGVTPRDAVDAAMSRIGAKHVAGIVLNGAEFEGMYSKYYDSYQTASSEPRNTRRDPVCESRDALA
jgi:capsular exopolysaccharide synthesis family protein